jgi:hypothetical protein
MGWQAASYRGRVGVRCVVAFRASLTCGAMNFGPGKSGWPTRSREIFRTKTPVKTVARERLPSRSFLQTATAYMTWRATSGSGRAIGMVRTITASSPQPARSRAILWGQALRSIRPNPANPKESCEAVRFSAQISIVPVTGSEPEVKARSLLARIISVSAA